MRELLAFLRYDPALKLPLEQAQNCGKAFIAIALTIKDCPAETDGRAIPSYLEGGLILGLSSTAIGTLVERTTRVTH